MLPKTTITKQDGNTGVVRPGAEGILAILAPASTGTSNLAGSYTRNDSIVSDYGHGRLVSLAAYALGVTGNPVVAVKTVASTAGAYGSFTLTGTGTSAPTAGATEPLDDLSPYIKVVAGGTIGVTGITYQYSVDGGTTLSGVTALGTATSVVLPNTGITINLGAGTLVAGDVIAGTTTSPAPTTSDLTAALEALRITGTAWDAALIDGVATTATVAQVDAWLQGLEAVGKFKTAVMNIRRKNAGESESAYTAAVTALSNAVTSTRVVVCADGGDAVDATLGVAVPRPTSMFVAARGEAIDIGQDPAYVALGAVSNCIINDARENPKYHDESKYPNLDDLRYTTLRTFDGRQGVYITNANLFSPSGSDYVYWQHARVMNKACEIAFQLLTGQLSRGVSKSSKVGPSGQRYISEEDAQALEGLVNAAFTNPLKGRVSEAAFTLSRTDDLSSNAGATLTGTVEIVALSYVKKFAVNARFVKSITVSAAA